MMLFGLLVCLNGGPPNKRERLELAFSANDVYSCVEHWWFVLSS